MGKRVKIYLKRGKEESLKRFHPWIFSGAIARADGEAVEGDLVDVYTLDETYLATGHCQQGSIAVRVLTFTGEEIDQAWWNGKIAAAYRMRCQLGIAADPQTDAYRLVHGEGDNLPGLVVDIYGRTAVIQAHSAGMYFSRERVVEALRTVLDGRLDAVYDKSGATLPRYAEIDAHDGYLWGKGAGEEVVSENGLKFGVNWESGQKTGFFLDQRDNRALVRHYAGGKRVLNTFCYTGGFSVYALAGGALQVDSVDSSEKAVEGCRRNVELNFGAEAPHRAFAVNALDYLKDIEGKYDLIILDPPAFAKHRNVLDNALRGYRRINAEAIRQIAPGGILFTFSCSQAVTREQFRASVFTAAAMAGRRVRILHQLTQPADHPVNIYHPEGEYLKGLVLFVE